MVERDQPGEDCLWTGRVPSMALHAAAEMAANARNAARFGMHTGEVQFDFATGAFPAIPDIGGLASAHVLTIRTRALVALRRSRTSRRR